MVEPVVHRIIAHPVPKDSPTKTQPNHRPVQDQVEVVLVGAILGVVDSQRAITNDAVEVRLPEVESIATKSCKWVRDQLAKEGVKIPLPTGN
jgi:hypothetical protein